MKLSDYKDEEAIDLLADIIEPASKIMADPEVGNPLRAGAPPIKAVKVALVNHRQEVIEIVAAIHRVPVEEMHFTVISLTKDVLDILNDPEIMAVFTLQSQPIPVEPSGSVTASLEAQG